MILGLEHYHYLDFSKLSDEAFDSFLQNEFPYYVKVFGESRIELYYSVYDSFPVLVFFNYKAFEDFLLSPGDWI